MTFDARTVATSGDKPFPFIGMDGETYELPHMNNIPSWQLRDLNAGKEEVLAEIAGDDVYEAIMEMPGGASEKLMTAWTEHCGKLGKPQAPSSQTQRRSKRRKRT